MKKLIAIIVFAMAFFVGCRSNIEEFRIGLQNLHQDFCNIRSNTQVSYEQDLIRYFNGSSFRENLTRIYSNLEDISADILILTPLNSFGIDSQELLVNFLLKILTDNLILISEDYAYSCLTLISLFWFCFYIQNRYFLITREYGVDYGQVDYLVEKAVELKTKMCNRINICGYCTVGAFLAAVLGIVCVFGVYYC